MEHSSAKATALKFVLLIGIMSFFADFAQKSVALMPLAAIALLQASYAASMVDFSDVEVIALWSLKQSAMSL